MFLLPPEMIGFYKSNIQFLSEHAVDPDKRRYVLPQEAPRHYIDLDQYKKEGRNILPQEWDKAVEMFSEDTLQAHGIVPWWIQIMKFKLTHAFQEKDKDEILKISADLGHYIGDAHVPLHASSNHNGQLTNQIGIHGLWESRLPELFATTRYDMLMEKATYLQHPLAFIWERINQSSIASEAVLKIEKKLSVSMDEQHIFSYEKRNGKYERVYSTGYATQYHQALKGMVEQRMRDATYAIACFWYTAWVDAGQPNLSDFSHSK